MELDDLLGPDRTVIGIAIVLAAPIIYGFGTIRLGACASPGPDGCPPDLLTPMYEAQTGVFLIASVIVLAGAYLMAAFGARVVYPRIAGA